MAKFENAEIEALKVGGNEVAKRIWMARWTPSDFPIPDDSDPAKLREFLRLKYKEKRWWDPLPAGGRSGAAPSSQPVAQPQQQSRAPAQQQDKTQNIQV